MFWRIFTLMLCQAVPALAAWFLGKDHTRWIMAVPAALAGSYLWITLDTMYGLQLLR